MGLAVAFQIVCRDDEIAKMIVGVDEASVSNRTSWAQSVGARARGARSTSLPPFRR